MNALSVVLLSLALVAGAHAFCYDQAVAKDQFFDDAWVCNENQAYPGQYIEQDLLALYNDRQLINYAYFLDTATSCFNETSWYTQSYAAPGDYAYQCVCPSPRKLVTQVYVNSKICHVVHPEKQDIQYAKCNTHCSFDYGTKIATASRGYFCVNQNFIKREFLVWCPAWNLAAPTVPTGYGQVANKWNYYGTFQKVSYLLPTLCSCRGYFCEDHSHLPGPH